MYLSEYSDIKDSTAGVVPHKLRFLNKSSISSSVGVVSSVETCTFVIILSLSNISSSFLFLPRAEVKSISFIGKYSTFFNADGMIHSHCRWVQVSTSLSLCRASK